MVGLIGGETPPTFLKQFKQIGVFTMNEQQEPTIEELISKLPRSVVDVNQDGSATIHPVDMVQAQMDREKEFKALLEQNHALRMKIHELQTEATEPAGKSSFSSGEAEVSEPNVGSID